MEFLVQKMEKMSFLVLQFVTEKDQKLSLSTRSKMRLGKLFNKLFNYA
jgi:hypothetical protein